MKRLVKVLLGVVGGAVVLLIIAFVAAAAFLDLDKLVNDQIAQHKPELETKLGRKVEVGPVTTHIFPTLSARVEKISIAADPNHKEDDQPLVQIGALGFEFSLWDALITRGQELHVARVYAEDVKASVVRYADGRLSYQDILERQPPSTPEKSEPMSADMQQRIANASIGAIELHDINVRLVDLDTPTHQRAEEKIQHLDIDVHDVRVNSPIKVHVDAAVLADAKNFELDTLVGPVAANLELPALPIGDTHFTASAIDLARVAPYLGPAVPVKITSAVADADIKLAKQGATISSKSFVDVKHIQLENGQPFDARIDATFDADTEKLSLTLQEVKVKLGAAELDASGSLTNLATKPEFHDFKVHTTSLDPSLLFAYDPATKANLPPGFAIAGAGSLDVTANGDAAKQRVDASLDLTNLDINDPNALVKPHGVPMALKVAGTFADNDAQLEKAELVLDAMDLVASGAVKHYASPDFDLTLAAKPFPFDRLARVIPSLHAALEQQHATAQGEGRIDGHLKGTLQNLDAALTIALSQVKLDAAGTKLDGSVTLAMAAKGDPQKSMSADASMDATASTVVLPGTIDKTAGTPLKLELHAQRSPTQLDVKTFDVQLAELQVHASGSFDLDKHTTSLAVNVAPLDIEKFARTVTAIPAEKAKGGFADVKVALGGDPNKLETLSLDVNPLNVKYGNSDLRGSLHVQNLSKPDAKMAVACNRLDLDTMFGAEKTNDHSTKAAPKKTEEVDNPKLKDVTFEGTFTANELIYSQTHMTNFRGSVHLKNGLLTLDDATFGVWGGTVSAKGTTAEIWKGRMPFHAKLDVKKIDVAQALAQKTKYGAALQGQGDFAVDLSGNGFESAELEQALTGNLGAAITHARYGSASLSNAVLGSLGPTLSKLPGAKSQLAGADTALDDLIASFNVQNGKMQLAKPLTAGANGGKLTLDGAIGIAGGLFLTGTYGMPGALLSQATGGKCKVNDLPVPVNIGGTVSKPSIAPDVGQLGANLIGACLGGAMSNALGQGKAQVEQQAQAAVTAAKQQAANAAAQAQANAKAQADAAAAKAKSDADARAAKAKADADAKAKAAEDAAKKKASDALGGIHF